ncbi:hypothetical protein C8R43DRAFT_1121191 [Mycena crocata]|nr:hypothetical protein C8R43DRAFT_1121191 [Mycena crocata]
MPPLRNRQRRARCQNFYSPGGHSEISPWTWFPTQAQIDEDALARAALQASTTPTDTDTPPSNKVLGQWGDTNVVGGATTVASTSHSGWASGSGWPGPTMAELTNDDGEWGLNGWASAADPVQDAWSGPGWGYPPGWGSFNEDDAPTGAAGGTRAAVIAGGACPIGGDASITPPP